MYKENQGGDRFKGGLIIWHRREVVAPQPSVPAHKSSKYCKNANIFRKIKSKCKITQLHVMSMSLSSVWGVWMCVCVYIQKSEAAIRGFLPKNTDVEKTERAQENLWFNTDETRFIRLTASHSPLSPADGAKAVKDKPVLPVTNVTSLGEVRQKKFGATKIRLIRGRRMIGQDVWGFLALRCAWQTFQNNKIYLHHHHHCHAFFWRKQDDKHRHRYNHALTKPPRGEGDESALRTFDTLGLSRERLKWHQDLSVSPPRFMLQQCREVVAALKGCLVWSQKRNRGRSGKLPAEKTRFSGKGSRQKKGKKEAACSAKTLPGDET